MAIRVSIDNIHITLQFLGDVSEEKAAKAKEALERIREVPFKATIKGISHFGGRDMHTIFANVQDGGRIKGIFLDIGKSLSDVEIDFETEREYIPHVTIARVKQGGAEIKEFITQNSERHVRRVRDKVGVPEEERAYRKSARFTPRYTKESWASLLLKSSLVIVSVSSPARYILFSSSRS